MTAALVAAIPGLAVYFAFIAALGVAIWWQIKHPTEPDWLEIKRANCKKDTNHRLDRAPGASLIGLFPRLPGVYAETTCRCNYRYRSRWVGFASSKLGQDVRKSGKVI